LTSKDSIFPKGKKHHKQCEKPNHKLGTIFTGTELIFLPEMLKIKKH
jgi:hypothetical protein